MENAADALKMAAAVLIFIIAIASSFSLFGTAKQTADSIINMRDKQKYLESAQLDTVLYTSSSKIKEGNVEGFTSNGDRIVNISDVFSTIYRYSKEKYGVTIMKSTGDIIIRFDSNTENIMRQYNNITNKEAFQNYITNVNNHIANTYVTNPNLTEDKLKEIYKVDNSYGAPWYGNNEEIKKRINVEIDSKKNTFYEYNGQKHEGIQLSEKLQGKKIIEVTNEFDQSKYLKDNDTETTLLQEYTMPTVEVVYIVYD